MVEKQKTEATAAKRQKTRGGISLFNEEEKDYESVTGDKIDPNQANDKYPLQL